MVGPLKSIQIGTAQIRNQEPVSRMFSTVSAWLRDKSPLIRTKPHFDSESRLGRVGNPTTITSARSRSKLTDDSARLGIVDRCICAVNRPPIAPLLVIGSTLFWVGGCLSMCQPTKGFNDCRQLIALSRGGYGGNQSSDSGTAVCIAERLGSREDYAGIGIGQHLCNFRYGFRVSNPSCGARGCPANRLPSVFLRHLVELG
jgi:hypothetical protein